MNGGVRVDALRYARRSSNTARPYALRHTYASIAIAAGASLFELPRRRATADKKTPR